jgi:hypothetical protein
LAVNHSTNQAFLVDEEPAMNNLVVSPGSTKVYPGV